MVLASPEGAPEARRVDAYALMARQSPPTAPFPDLDHRRSARRVLRSASRPQPRQGLVAAAALRAEYVYQEIKTACCSTCSPQP